MEKINDKQDISSILVTLIALLAFAIFMWQATIRNLTEVKKPVSDPPTTHIYNLDGTPIDKFTYTNPILGTSCDVEIIEMKLVRSRESVDKYTFQIKIDGVLSSYIYNTYSAYSYPSMTLALNIDRILDQFIRRWKEGVMTWGK